MAPAGCGADAERSQDGDCQGLCSFAARAGCRVRYAAATGGDDPPGGQAVSTIKRDNMTAGAETGLETKSADIGMALEELMYSFEAFKDANDQRLKEIEKRSAADPVTAEKVERISSALDEQKRLIDGVVLKNARPALDADGARSVDALERKQAFEAYMRSGDERKLRAFEEKAMSYGSAQDGGYLVPDETEREIGRRLAQISPIRSIATVKRISAAVLKKPFATSGIGTGWVAETAPRPQTATNTLAELSFPTAELYA